MKGYEAMGWNPFPWVKGGMLWRKREDIMPLTKTGKKVMKKGMGEHWEMKRNCKRCK